MKDRRRSLFGAALTAEPQPPRVFVIYFASDSSDLDDASLALLDEVIKEIESSKPDLVFAPHVETASGIILPDDYLTAVAEATHKNGGLFVLDCVASGAMWVNMRDIGVDILVSAPQKGWSASPCSGFVMMGSDATERIAATTSSSFACDLKKWMQIG